MPTEVQSYRLTYRGKPAGTHTLTTFEREGTTFMEGRMHLQGGLRQGTVQQRSRFDSETFESRHFEESNQSRGDKRNFDVEVLEAQGLVRGRKGQEVVELPSLLPYRDPLSMLHELRTLDASAELVRIPMHGKDVSAKLLSTAPLDTALGKRTARTYLLQPGGSYVYLDSQAPNLILKLVQRLDEAYVEAQLIKVASENAEPDWATQQPPRQRKRSRRRRGRRRKPQKR
jgi:hypothetical protein